MRKSILALFTVLAAAPAYAQQMSYSDAAQAYNRILLEKGDGTYQRISAYKVVGTQYLFGERHTGDLYSPGEMALNIRVSYNTYNQQVEFYTKENPTKPLVKDAKDVDSFRLRPDPAIGLPDQQLVFVSGKALGTSGNTLYQRVSAGPKYSLFKKYKSTLGIVTTSYVDADLRQFNLEFEFYYFDHAKNQFKKLKPNQSSVEKEFPQLTSPGQLFIDYPIAANPELTLKQVFLALNK
ncbi:hypothetical protein [Flaviaesturariibacter amylovorans]|uniref:DUF3857 domain-containing protein n=1 Tax=Flaviaesturariibacter amylovorans TaxID=1084520 RepID=A0ABP8G953_9BACT